MCRYPSWCSQGQLSKDCPDLREEQDKSIKKEETEPQAVSVKEEYFEPEESKPRG